MQLPRKQFEIWKKGESDQPAYFLGMVESCTTVGVYVAIRQAMNYKSLIQTMSIFSVVKHESWEEKHERMMEMRADKEDGRE